MQFFDVNAINTEWEMVLIIEIKNVWECDTNKVLLVVVTIKIHNRGTHGNKIENVSEWENNFSSYDPRSFNLFNVYPEVV